MATLTLRNAKGSPLTNQEADDNLSALLVAIGGTNSSPYTLPIPSGTGGPVLTSGPTIDTPRITSELRINNTANTYYVGFKAGTLSANKIWTLPTADGSANQILKTDGSGNLGWANAGTSGNMNCVQTVGTKTTVLSSATFPYTVVSVTITTTGGNVLVTVYGDAENATAATWGRLALYRGTTKIGSEVQFESNGGSENCPYACIVIDNPVAGTYTYSMKITTLAGGNFNFGELDGPVITATELTGVVGPQGPAGSGGGGTVTSIGLSVPTDFLSVSNTPITSSGTITLSLASNPLLPKLLIGPTASANYTRFPNSLTAISNTAAGIQKNESHNIGLVAEGTAHATDTTIYGVGVYGKGYTNAATRSGGVVGEGHVSATGDTGSAIGVRGYSNDTHAGGMNIGLYADANNGATNYALYMNSGNITNVAAQTWTLGGNLTFSGAYSVTIPTLSLTNALPVASGGTGLTSPGTSGNVLTSNGTTWVSSAPSGGGSSSSSGFETNFLLMGA